MIDMMVEAQNHEAVFRKSLVLNNLLHLSLFCHSNSIAIHHINYFSYTCPSQQAYFEQGLETEAYKIMEVAITLKHEEGHYCLNYMKLFSKSESA